MAQIIPAILAQTEAEFRRQVSLAAAFAPAIQVDVLDGTMLPERCFGDPRIVAAMRLSRPFEAHLMIDRPEKQADAWIRSGARTLIAHVEAKGNLGLFLEKTRNAGRVAGLAINPGTDLALLKEWAPFTDRFQVMGVHPGGQGRAFDPEAVDRVRSLRLAYPHIAVSVDGGVTDAKRLARKLVEAGADELVVGSAIWTAPDPARAYREITSSVDN